MAVATAPTRPSQRSRIPGVPDGRGGPIVRYAARVARREYGHVPEPLRVSARSPWIHRGYLAFEYALMHAHRVDSGLKDLAGTRVAQLADCPFCVAIGSALLQARGVEASKIAAIGVEAEQHVYTELEALAMEYAAAMTATPAGVTDELVDRLRAHLDEEQIVELTAAIAFENYRARFNHAMGIGPETYDLRRHRH